MWRLNSEDQQKMWRLSVKIVFLSVKFPKSNLAGWTPTPCIHMHWNTATLGCLLPWRKSLVHLKEVFEVVLLLKMRKQLFKSVFKKCNKWNLNRLCALSSCRWLAILREQHASVTLIGQFFKRISRWEWDHGGILSPENFRNINKNKSAVARFAHNNILVAQYRNLIRLNH